MKFTIRGSKVKVTEPIKQYIEGKIGKLNKYFENPDEITASIVIKIRGKDQIVEVTIAAPKLILRGEESHTDLYASIDLVSDKIERQIRKNKSRLKKASRTNINILTDFDTLEETKDKSEIIRRKTIETKPMSEEEAILQMNLIDHDFFVFMNEKTENYCVIYKRKDGNYGIMEIK